MDAVRARSGRRAGHAAGAGRRGLLPLLGRRGRARQGAGAAARGREGGARAPTTSRRAHLWGVGGDGRHPLPY